jgi:hypothetical protein
VLTVKDLKELLDRVPADAPIAVVEGDDYEHKYTVLSEYYSANGEVVIQFWN